MTWIEVGLILSAAGVLLGAMTPRRTAGRLLLWGSFAVLIVLAAIFGPELVNDLL